jgi:hypothetical protein
MNIANRAKKTLILITKGEEASKKEHSNMERNTV